ncbi:unnamed protein product [Caenorhabditis bovis]|uniref:Bestrophin homolog n=1 Tax=Caenorhabditis bovis TaxID=2654633 RepID=A0A8S1F1P2_9PELO|nr:unnamed protein product [Caenorhabditis bovis]
MTISYNGNVVRILMRWKGSIWRTVWKELVIYLLFFYAIRLFYLRGFELIDDDESDQDKMRKQFEAFCRMCDSYTRLIPLTFLLGFYVSNVVARWWRQFETLYWPEDILSVLCTVVHQNDEANKKRRHTIARYLNLSAALAWRDISSKIRLRFPNVHSLIDGGLLTEKEFEILEKIHEECESTRWMTPIHWIQHILRQVEENKPTASLLNHFVAELRIFRQSLRKLYSYDWVCVPLVYTQVAALATYAFFFFSLFGRQTLIPDVESGKEIDLRIPLFTIVQFLFFVGWFKVGQDLMRPFGLDDDDIELNYILDRNMKVSFSIVNQLQSSPPPNFDAESDKLWRESQNGNALVPALPHSKYSRQLSEHRPRLHAYIPVEENIKDIESSKGCMKIVKNKKKMGNQYVKPQQTGNSPYTRSGVPPPALTQTSDKPLHRVNDRMSLELHMADERVRAAGLSPAEREWRKKWVHDQHLHADEPIVVDAVHRQLNPIRTLYRLPWDKFYLHYLKPTFGVYYGTAIRVTVPKVIMAFVFIQTAYYYWKYEVKDWTHLRGLETMPQKEVYLNAKTIEEKHPGLMAKGLANPAKDDYYTPTFNKRTAYLDVGETKRPW